MVLLSDGHGDSPHALRLGPFTPIPGWRPKLSPESEKAVEGRFVLEASEVEQLRERNGMDTDTLLQALVVPAARLALPHLSGFYVGAVGLGSSGRVYMGGNMEFPGGTLANSVHAEQCLIANLLRNKERGLVTVAISASPCGHCRQFFSELCCADTFRIIFDEGPDNVYILKDVLPHRFGPQSLLTNGNQPLLLEEQHHALVWTPEAKSVLDRRKSETGFQEAAAAALTAARGSYSPYRKVPSGVALVSVRGVHAGGCVENAAHNPTLQPLQAAFASALFDGMAEYSMAKEAVLVELPDVPVQQQRSVSALLAAVAPEASVTVLHVHHQ